jgi:hypothetical protein
VIRTLKLLGCPSVTALDRSFVDMPADWLTASQLRAAFVSAK